MYINASVYEDLYLKGKPIEDVEREVFKMRAELKRLKYALETPVNYGESLSRASSKLESINVTREYLNRALLYYAELKGDNSVLTEEERVSATLRSLRMNVRSVTLNLGGSVYVIDILGSKILTLSESGDPDVRKCDRSQLISAVADLRIEEWRENYTAEDYGCTLIDPVSWSVEVYYGEEIPMRTHRGEGVYPYNFNALRRILRIN